MKFLQKILSFIFNNSLCFSVVVVALYVLYVFLAYLGHINYKNLLDFNIIKFSDILLCGTFSIILITTILTSSKAELLEKNQIQKAIGASKVFIGAVIIWICYNIIYKSGNFEIKNDFEFILFSCSLPFLINLISIISLIALLCFLIIFLEQFISNIPSKDNVELSQTKNNVELSQKEEIHIHIHK